MWFFLLWLIRYFKILIHFQYICINEIISRFIMSGFYTDIQTIFSNLSSNNLGTMLPLNVQTLYKTAPFMGPYCYKKSYYQCLTMWSHIGPHSTIWQHYGHIHEAIYWYKNFLLPLDNRTDTVLRQYCPKNSCYGDINWYWNIVLLLLIVFSTLLIALFFNFPSIKVQ